MTRRMNNISSIAPKANKEITEAGKLMTKLVNAQRAEWGEEGKLTQDEVMHAFNNDADFRELHMEALQAGKEIAGTAASIVADQIARHRVADQIAPAGASQRAIERARAEAERATSPEDLQTRAARAFLREGDPETLVDTFMTRSGDGLEQLRQHQREREFWNALEGEDTASGTEKQITKMSADEAAAALDGKTNWNSREDVPEVHDGETVDGGHAEPGGNVGETEGA